jgi:hypothetical protein
VNASLQGTEDRQDQMLRRDIRTAIAKSLAGSIGWLVLAVAFLALSSSLSEPSVTLVAGFLTVCALFLLPLPWMLIWRRRPRVTLDGGGIMARGARAYGIVIMGASAAGVATGIAMLSVPDWNSTALSRLIPIASALLTLGVPVGLAMTVRPQRLRVNPELIAFKDPFPRRRTVTWRDVQTIDVPAQAPVERLGTLPLTITARADTLMIHTIAIRPTVWVLSAWLNHYLAHPEDRHELATQAGIDRLDVIQAAHMAVPNRPWPRWFPPPLASSDDDA